MSVCRQLEDITPLNHRRHYQTYTESENVYRARILVQVTIYRRLRIGRDVHLDQSEAYDFS